MHGKDRTTRQPDRELCGGLAGARFQAHPAIQPPTVRVEDRAHPSTAGPARTWNRTDQVSFRDIRIGELPREVPGLRPPDTT